MSYTCFPVNDRQRSTYLDAIGIDRYVSRFQLPGAALSRRPLPVSSGGLAPLADDSAAPAIPLPQGQPESVSSRKPALEMPLEQRLPARREPPRQAAPAAAELMPRFSLATIVAGNWLWVEELEGMPLAREQVQVVQAMANALQRVGKGPFNGDPTQARQADIAQFDWPMHNNQQLDLGADAARAALGSFLTRRLAQDGLGLVLLGQAAAARVTLGELDCHHISLPHSSADLLARPELKKHAWSVLRTIPGLA